MKKIKDDFDSFLRLAHTLNNTTNSNLSESELATLNSDFNEVRRKLKGVELNNDQIHEKKQALLNNLSTIKETVEEFSRRFPNWGLSIDQSTTRRNELFRRLSSEISFIICDKYNGEFVYEDLRLTNDKKDIVPYNDFIAFINTETSILNDFDLESFYSFIQYYRAFQDRLIQKFKL